MTIQIEFWQVVTFAVTLISAFAGLIRLLFSQVEKRQDERWKAQEEARETGARSLHQMIAQHVDDERSTHQRVDALAEEVDEMARSMSGMRSKIEVSVTHHDLSKVYDSINAMSSTVNHMAGEFSSMTTLMRQIFSRIIERGME
jgi:phage shock protein A